MVLFCIGIYALSFWGTGFATFTGELHFNSSVDKVKMVEPSKECDIENPTFEGSVEDGDIQITAKGLRIPYKLCLYSNGELESTLELK